MMTAEFQLFQSFIAHVEITRQLALEIWEIAGDHRDVEATEDGFLRLAVEQEAESRLDAALRRVPAGQPLTGLARHRDMVMSLAPAFPHDDLEGERVGVARLTDFDHGSTRRAESG